MASLWAFGGLAWGELLRRVRRQVVSDDAFGRSAHLSCFFLSSLFPLLFGLLAALWPAGVASEAKKRKSKL